jgi:hypothetical protein
MRAQMLTEACCTIEVPVALVALMLVRVVVPEVPVTEVCVSVFVVKLVVIIVVVAELCVTLVALEVVPVKEPV